VAQRYSGSYGKFTPFALFPYVVFRPQGLEIEGQKHMPRLEMNMLHLDSASRNPAPFYAHAKILVMQAGR